MKEDRPHLLTVFRNILYAKTGKDYDTKKAEFFKDKICLKYPNFISRKMLLQLQRCLGNFCQK